MRILWGLLFLSNLVLAQSLSFLETIQSQVMQDPDFNRTYTKSGCYIRAHWIAKMIHDEGHAPLKVFIQTPSKAEKMEVKLLSGEVGSWIYHVVAGYKNPDGKIWVIDPVVFNTPVTLETWLGSIKKQNPQLKISMKITGPEVYHVDAEENKEFASYGGGPFSQRSMSFIRDGMNILYFWESFKD